MGFEHDQRATERKSTRSSFDRTDPDYIDHQIARARADFATLSGPDQIVFLAGLPPWLKREVLKTLSNNFKWGESLKDIFKRDRGTADSVQIHLAGIRLYAMGFMDEFEKDDFRETLRQLWILSARIKALVQYVQPSEYKEAADGIVQALKDSILLEYEGYGE